MSRRRHQRISFSPAMSEDRQRHQVQRSNAHHTGARHVSKPSSKLWRSEELSCIEGTRTAKTGAALGHRRLEKLLSRNFSDETE
jgi:hypothetical protein